MRRPFLFATVVGLFLSTGLILAGQHVSAEPAPAAPAKRPYTPADKITGDYAKLTLTPEQETKILALQKDAKIKIRKIEDELDAGCMALLDDKQKKQLDDMEKEQKDKVKAHQAEKRKEEKAEKAEQKKAEKTAAPAEKAK
jgi:hypothetical protein